MLVAAASLSMASPVAIFALLSALVWRSPKLVRLAALPPFHGLVVRTLRCWHNRRRNRRMLYLQEEEGRAKVWL
ncbi:MAG: hypothetical protein WCD51_15405, partial [Anaerolineae bacterium]